MKKTCSNFKDTILDYVYEELEPKEKDVFLSHLATCEHCKMTLESTQLTRKMATQLPPVQIPDTIEAANLFKMADQAAATFKQATIQTSKASEVGAEDSLHGLVKEPGFLEKMRQLFLQPALATLAVASLAVIAGVCFVKFSEKPVTNGANNISAAPFFGPSKKAASASPVITEVAVNDLKSTPKTMEQLHTALQDTPANNFDREKATIKTEAPAKKFPRRARASKGSKGLAVGSGANYPLNSAVQLESASPSSDLTPKGFNGAGSEPPNRFNGASKKAKREANQHSNAALDESVSSADFSEREQSKPQTDFDIGVAAFQNNNCGLAKSKLQSTLDSPTKTAAQVATALRYIGKCEKNSGHCGKALVHFERFLTRFNRHGSKPSVLWDAAICHQKLGHRKRARELLNELTHFPNWQEKATRQLSKLDTD